MEVCVSWFLLLWLKRLNSKIDLSDVLAQSLLFFPKKMFFNHLGLVEDSFCSLRLHFDEYKTVILWNIFYNLKYCFLCENIVKCNLSSISLVSSAIFFGGRLIPSSIKTSLVVLYQISIPKGLISSMSLISMIGCGETLRKYSSLHRKGSSV